MATAGAYGQGGTGGSHVRLVRSSEAKLRSAAFKSILHPVSQWFSTLVLGIQVSLGKS